MTDVTQIIAAIGASDPHATEQLLPLVYDELRRLAADHLAHEKSGQTLQATALVHEAYLRTVSSNGGNTWNSRGHFFAAAAEAMRRILVENARRKHCQKHGGHFRRTSLHGVSVALDAPSEALIALDAALDKLSSESPE